jgi:hypothetical protein
MTNPEQEGDWVSGRKRFDQIFYDWAGINTKLQNTSPFIRTWVKHFYNRDRTPEEATHKIIKHVAINYTAAYWLEKKVPEIATWRSYWPLFCGYIYIKNAASFNTLFLTGINDGSLGYVRANSRMWQAIEKGEFLPTD